MVYNLSPYAYCAGNPMKYIDKDGQKTRIYISSVHLWTIWCVNREFWADVRRSHPRGRGSLWQVVKGSSLWSITVIPYIFDVDLSIQSFLSKDLTKIKDPQAFVEELLESFYKQ